MRLLGLWEKLGTAAVFVTQIGGALLAVALGVYGVTAAGESPWLLTLVAAILLWLWVIGRALHHEYRR